jgi:FkbM family methyltransferase
MRYPYRLYTSLKTPRYVDRLGWRTGTRTVRAFLTTPAGALLEAPVPGTGRRVLVRSGSSDRRCYEQIFIERDYELAYRGTPSLIVDGGANVGYSTVYFACRYPNARVIAIEPEPSNVALLLRNVEGLANVDVVEAALWGTEASVSIANPDDEKWSFSVRAFDGGGLAVPGVTIDSIRRRSGADRIGILKLDVEGAEVELFEGAARWIEHVDQVVVELHPRKRPTCPAVFEEAIANRARARRTRGENQWVAFV